MKKISIVGASISTYKNCNPDGYAVYYDAEIQSVNDMTGPDDTWWAQVIQALDGELCVNNSYSGSRVSGRGFPAACCEERTSALRTGTDRPDLILVYIGFNDFGYGVPVKRAGLTSDLTTFADAYVHMLRAIRQKEPQAAIVCGTIMRTVMRYRHDWQFPEDYGGLPLEQYNDAIRRACRRAQCLLADTSALDLRYETLDGTHPTRKGHATIAEAWCRCLQQLF